MLGSKTFDWKLAQLLTEWCSVCLFIPAKVLKILAVAN